MKWYIARIIIALALAFQFQIFGWLDKPLPVNAATSTADVTVYVRIEYEGVLPPSGFRVTRITDTEVLLEWTPAEGSANTSIRMKINSLPEDINDGYLVYTGNASTFTDTWLHLDYIWSEIYYIAYSENATGGYSESYAWGYTESPYVEEVADNLLNLGSIFQVMSDYIPHIIGFLICVVITAVAFWRRGALLYALAGLSWIAYGAMEFSTNIYLSFILFAFGVCCFIYMALDRDKAVKR